MLLYFRLRFKFLVESSIFLRNINGCNYLDYRVVDIVVTNDIVVYIGLIVVVFAAVVAC